MGKTHRIFFWEAPVCDRHVLLARFFGEAFVVESCINPFLGEDLTTERARRAIAQADESLKSLAFATIIKNRVNQGGILAKVASFIKDGENGKGITSRWYHETLRRRILAIAQVKRRSSRGQALATPY
jgi:hypothetical protein